MKNLKILLLFYLSLFFCGSSLASEDEWLIGKWLHSHNDPNQTTQIVFSESGEGELEFTALSMVLSGTYKVAPDAVYLDVKHPNFKFDTMNLLPDEDRKELLLKEKNGETKIYVKQ